MGVLYVQHDISKLWIRWWHLKTRFEVKIWLFFRRQNFGTLSLTAAGQRQPLWTRQVGTFCLAISSLLTQRYLTNLPLSEDFLSWATGCLRAGARPGFVSTIPPVFRKEFDLAYAKCLINTIKSVWLTCHHPIGYNNWHFQYLDCQLLLWSWSPHREPPSKAAIPWPRIMCPSVCLEIPCNVLSSNENVLGSFQLFIFVWRRVELLFVLKKRKKKERKPQESLQ